MHGFAPGRSGEVLIATHDGLMQADFHVLEARSDRVYADDGQAGVLRTSSDGRRRRERRPPNEIASPAIDPADGDRLVIATPSGLATSSNAGKSGDRFAAPSPATCRGLQSVGSISRIPSATSC